MAMLDLKSVLEMEENANASFRCSVMQVSEMRNYHSQGGEKKESFEAILADKTDVIKLQIYGGEKYEMFKKRPTIYILKGLVKSG